MTIWQVRDTKKEPEPEINYEAIACILIGAVIGFIVGFVVG